MYLKRLLLQNFRNYSKSEFTFSKGSALIVGPNTSGKTNLIEAIYFLSGGKSFRGSDKDAIAFDKDIARVKGELGGKLEESLEVVLSNIEERFVKKYLVNGVGKLRINFAGRLPVVLFTPEDLNLVLQHPSIRRNYLDSVLEQTDQEYRRSWLFYEKGLRARNKLLENVKKSGVLHNEQFEYWDNIVINNGNVITDTREKFLQFVNNAVKDIFNFKVLYEKSIISKERLLQYRDAELATGVTLVGPHRDDFSMLSHQNKNTANKSELKEVKFFGSRGEQRLAVLQLKMIDLKFLTDKLGEKPLLLLDDIFSELDQEHISLVLKMIKGQQTIITTTHKELVEDSFLKDASVIELDK